MEKPKLKETLIAKVHKEDESVRSTQDICQKLGVSNFSFYNWIEKYGDL